MKLDKRVIVGGLVVIGGIILLWLLNRPSTNAADDSQMPESQPAPGGDSTIPMLPDVGDIRFQTAPPVRQTPGGCGCEDDKDCGGMGSYITSVAPVMLPEAYIETAYASLQSSQPSYPTRSMA